MTCCIILVSDIFILVFAVVLGHEVRFMFIANFASYLTWHAHSVDAWRGQSF